jgi:hypothetical protein
VIVAIARSNLPGHWLCGNRCNVDLNLAGLVPSKALVLSGLANFQMGGRRVPLPACELASIRLRAECLV